MSKAQENAGWIFTAIFAAILLWLLTKGQSVLHGSATVTFLQPDPATGAPVFNSNDPTTYDVNAFAKSVKAVCNTGLTGAIDPTSCSCPSGYTMWYDSNSGNYFCFPTQS
jgi:hypothetical protein